MRTPHARPKEHFRGLSRKSFRTSLYISQAKISGSRLVSVLEAGHSFRLWSFLPLDNVELDFVTFFERFVPGRLNR